MPEPLVRARNLVQWLELVDAEPEPWRGRFRQALPADVHERIASSGHFDWLPAELHVRLADALFESFGAVRAHDYYRRALSRSVRGPVLGTLFRSGTRLLGLTPVAFLRWVRHGWASSFRDCGSIRGEALGPGHGRLVYENLPTFCTGSRPWVESAMGTAYGVYDLTRVQGVVRMDDTRLAQGGFELTLEWTAG